MRKIATIAAGAAFTAGVLLVPAAGFASATTTKSGATASSPVTLVHPRVSPWECEAGGGVVLFVSDSIVCIGGYFDDVPVW